MNRPVGVGIVGVGSWGARLARAFDDHPRVSLEWLCDVDPRRRLAAVKRHTKAAVTASFRDVLADDRVDAVVIATPPASHAELAIAALQRRKHVFVEQPLAEDPAHARAVVAAAKVANRCLVVGNTLLHDPAMRKLKELIETGELGDVVFLQATHHEARSNAPHDDAITSLASGVLAELIYLVDEDEPLQVSAAGACALHASAVEVVACRITFTSGLQAHVHCSRIDPEQSRRVTVVGSRRSGVLDATKESWRLALYDRPLDDRDGVPSAGGGDLIFPRLPPGDAIDLQVEHVVEAASSGTPAAASSPRATMVVDAVAAVRRSLAADGAWVRVADAAVRQPMLQIVDSR